MASDGRICTRTGRAGVRRRAAAGRRARRPGTPVHVYSARARRRAVPRARTPRCRRRAAPAALRDQSQFDARHRAPAARRSARAPTPIPAANSKSRCAPVSRPPTSSCTGVGKTRAELERAIGLGVGAINVESPGEIARIERIAAAQGAVARVAVRINPDIEAGSHPHISTGHRATKFGMSADGRDGLLRDMARQPWMHVVGLHMHVGSQITRARAVRRRRPTHSSAWRAAWRTRASASSTSMSAADSGSRTEPGQPVVASRTTRSL